MRNGGDIAAIRSRGVSSSLLLIICRQFFCFFAQTENAGDEEKNVEKEMPSISAGRAFLFHFISGVVGETITGESRFYSGCWETINS